MKLNNSSKTMRCIFCKVDSSTSKSIEHIIPESLGNVEHVLPPGIVCDKCNNYFASKIEQRVLESHYFLYSRFENLIPSKKGKMPAVKGFIPFLKSPVDIEITEQGVRIIIDKKDRELFEKSSHTNKSGQLYIFHPDELKENRKLFSRFLGKIALEALAVKALETPNGLDVNIIDNEELNPLREYIRYGKQNISWSFHQRQLYPANARFYSEEEQIDYDVLHEFTFLYTENEDLFFVIAFFGVEYTIDLGDTKIDKYLEWLTKNENRSPLYMDGIDYEAPQDGLIGIREGMVIEVFVRE